MTSALIPGSMAKLMHDIRDLAPHQRAEYLRAQLPVTLTVIKVRRDAKLVVSYSFPNSGRTIGKLLTLAQFHAEVAKHPDYVITGVRVPAAPAAAPADPSLAAFIADATGESNY